MRGRLGGLWYWGNDELVRSLGERHSHSLEGAVVLNGEGSGALGPVDGDGVAADGVGVGFAHAVEIHGGLAGFEIDGHVSGGAGIDVFAGDFGAAAEDGGAEPDRYAERH